MIPLNASDRWYIITLLSLLHSTSSPPCLHLLFLRPISPLFLSLKQTAFTRNGHNVLSVFIYFLLFFFNCTCCAAAPNHLFMRIDAFRVCCYDEAIPKMQFLGMSYKMLSQRSQISPKWKLFSHHSSLQSSQSDFKSIIYHNQHLSFIDLTHRGFEWKMILMIRYIRIWMFNYKSISKLYSFPVFNLASIAYLISNGCISQFDQFAPSVLNPHLTIDKSLKLSSGKFIL